MRKSIITTAVLTALTLSACSKAPTTQETPKQTPQSETAQMQQSSSNVLLRQSQLQYQAPEFDKITFADYAPAFSQGMSEHDAEIAKIVNNPDAASFDNTIVAMERAGSLLSRTAKIFFNLASVNSDAQIQALQAELAPKLSAHIDNIFLNPQLFSRVDSVYQTRDQLSAEDKRLVEYYYLAFERAGAKLSDADKAKMRELNGQIASLTTAFSKNVLDSFKNDVIIVEDKAELDGLSDAEIATLAQAAKDAGKTGYLITLVNTTGQPILAQLNNRALRQRVWETSAHRAMDTNGPNILKQSHLHAEKAALLGYDSWAEYTVADQMSKKPSAVYEILDDLAPQAVAKAKQEAAEIQAEIKKSGQDFQLEPWDWAYYAEKVRKEKYDLDQSQVTPYFEFNRVLNDGLFFAMQKLYGITVKSRQDLPVWNSDVLAFEIFNKDDASIGIFYLDPYAREGKNGGAWMDEFVTQSGLLGTKPVVYNALNIPKPASGPTLMTFDEVTTMFHEFGHAVHGLFSDVKYPSLAGTATPRDFVEFPSQAHEDWAVEPQVLAHYAKHYQTGEPIPEALLTKVMAASNFGQGFDTTEYLAAAILDMEWHSIGVETKVDDVAQFEQQALAKHGIDFMPVPPRYKSAYFSHAFTGGYSAGYYAYLWTEVFAADAFDFMSKNGGLSQENGNKFRNNVLSKGNSEDLMQDYINFTGRKPSIDALLKRRGLIE